MRFCPYHGGGVPDDATHCYPCNKPLGPLRIENDKVEKLAQQMGFFIKELKKQLKKCLKKELKEQYFKKQQLIEQQFEEQRLKEQSIRQGMHSSFFIEDEQAEYLPYFCPNCHFVYNPNDNNNIPFEELHGQWRCPNDGTLKDEFKVGM